jgi:tetratricopeptide (TPR) repeat protein
VAPAGASYRADLIYSRGLISYHDARWEQAALAFDGAAKADPQNAAALYYRGLCNARLGFKDEARSDIERALELRPDLPAALDLGILYFEQGQSEQAEFWLQRAYHQAETRFSAALFLGLSHFRRGDDDAAHEFLVDAAKDPQLRQTAQYYDALLALRAGRTEEGRRLLDGVAQLNVETEIGRIAREVVGEPVVATTSSDGKPWSIGGYAGFQYDSNVPLAANDTDIEKSRGISGKQEGRSVLGVGAAYQIVDSNLGQGTLSYGLSQSLHFDASDFDLQGHRLRLDLSSPAVGFQYGVTGLYDFYLLNFEKFYQQGLAIPWVAYHENDVTATQLYYRFRSRDYLDDPFDPFRDGYNNAVGLRQFFLLGAVGRQLSVGYQWENENPISKDGNDFQYCANQVDLRFDFTVRDWFSGVAGYLFRMEDYQFRNSRTGSPPDFGRRRHDRQHQIVLHFERPLIPHLIGAVDYLGVINDTNIDEFEYNRQVLSGSIRVEF